MSVTVDRERVKIESFECSETASEPIEACEEAAQLMEELGLTEQLNLVTKNKQGNSQRCPYRHMTEEERFVYSTLCPESVKLSKYTASPLPLRILQIAAHARQCIPGCELMVWDKTKATVLDPVLVAETGDSWRPTRHILARWGAELETFATLLKQAFVVKREQLIQEAKSTLAEIEHSTDAELMRMEEVKVTKRY